MQLLFQEILNKKKIVASCAVDPCDCGRICLLSCSETSEYVNFPLVQPDLSLSSDCEVEPWKGQRRIAAAWL